MKYLLIAFVLMSLSAHAEVFKCKNATGKIIYQAEPCATGAVTQGVINVKQMSPEETAAAKEKLNAWQQQQAAEDAANQAAERERQAARERQESLELQRRSVNAQQQAVQGQQSYQYNSPLIVPGYGYNRPYWNNGIRPPNGGGGGVWGSPNYPYHRPHNGQYPINPNLYPSFEPYREPPPPAFRAHSFSGKQNQPNRPMPYPSNNPYNPYNQ
jgi:Domain of unknown function (DUF4124)